MHTPSSSEHYLLIISPSQAWAELLVQGKNGAAVTAPSVSKALEKIASNPPVLVVADDAAKEEADILAETCAGNIPVVWLWEYKGAQPKDTVLEKPVRASDLFRTVTAYKAPLCLAEGVYLFAEDRLLAENMLASRPLKLTEKETALLLFLHKQEGKPVERDKLLSAVWSYNPEHIDTHTLETHIYRLRQKIVEHFGGKEVVFSSGEGYFLVR